MNFHEQLRPLTLLMRRRRKDMQLTAQEVGALAGYGETWCTELETGKGMNNPSVRRLTEWAQALGAQELGLYVVIDGHYHAVPAFETEDKDLDDESA